MNPLTINFQRVHASKHMTKKIKLKMRKEDMASVFGWCEVA